LTEIKRSIRAPKFGLSVLWMTLAVALVLVISGCGGGYGHIPLARKNTSPEQAEAIQVTLQWNPVPNAGSYNVYWSRFPGVTKHNGHKIPDAANPITLTDLAPGTTYYFVVTVVDDSGESQESRQMSSAGVGASGGVDFQDLFEQPSPSPSPRAVRQEGALTEKKTPAAPQQEVQPAKQAPVAAQEKAQYSGNGRATLAWDSVPAAISYNIYWRNQPGVTKQNGRKVANVQSPHTLKDLISGKTYYLVVTAVSKSGESSISGEISYTVE
jgi:fibronectin type 3 domain-containing protein